jgi:excinuclease UvrABC helicase subunit UvrB
VEYLFIGFVENIAVREGLCNGIENFTKYFAQRAEG